MASGCPPRRWAGSCSGSDLQTPIQASLCHTEPREYVGQRPDDLVLVDTLDVCPLPNVVIKQLPGRDVVSRWDVIEVYRRATPGNARSFLESLVARSPYPMKTIQVNGGSEFQAESEKACQEKGIKLFVLPPRSPKLNRHVERAQRTHTEEYRDRQMGGTGFQEPELGDAAVRVYLQPCPAPLLSCSQDIGGVSCSAPPTDAPGGMSVSYVLTDTRVDTPVTSVLDFFCP